MPSSWNKLLPNSLLSIRDEKHRQARRTLTPVRFPSPALLYSASHKFDMGLRLGSGTYRPRTQLICQELSSVRSCLGSQCTKVALLQTLFGV